MFPKLEAFIKKLYRKITTAEKRHARADRRWQKNQAKAHREHKAAKAAERKAKMYTAQGHPKRAQAEEEKAKRCHHRAWKAHLRAEHYIRKAKEFALESAHYKKLLSERGDQLKKLEAEHGPRVSPSNANKVEGGSPKERCQFAMLKSMQSPDQFYSQEGSWNVRYALTGVPRGFRSDCSQWFTSIYWTCDFPDPNGGPEYIEGELQYTGSIGAGGRRIAESELDTGDAILYGTAPFFHMEMKDGPMSDGPWTVGHGSAPIDRGVVALVSGPRECRRYDKTTN